MTRTAARLATSCLCPLALAGCASFSILKPAASGTTTAPVAADVFWNAELQAGTLKVVVDPAGAATDVTSQFSAPSLASDSHATAHLNLPDGTHTLQVSGSLWDSRHHEYRARSTSQAFQVASGPGRPVTYTETIFNYTPGWPAGQLGNVKFGGDDPAAPNRNVNLIFTFDGNTSDVVAYYVPRGCSPNCTNNAVRDGSGFEIVAGTATVTVQDAGSGATLAQGTFLPGARVFVSVDNGNAGIGFGSLGALPTDPTFPNHGVEVAYPYAQFLAAYTDLKSNYSTTASWAISCMGFSGSPGQRGPGTCNLPLALATTAGTLSITSNDQQNTAPTGSRAAVFTTVVR